MPAEEGFPAYLPSRLSQFYERAGMVQTLGGGQGSVTIIGAVSPQGSDFSEPVTQNTKRFTRCFWALDKALAYARHYPAINWTSSYSEYIGDLSGWYAKNVGEDFLSCRSRVAQLLQEESQLMEIVKLIGADVLPDDQKLVIETARVIRVGFLQQNSRSSGRHLCTDGKTAENDAGDFVPARERPRARRRRRASFTPSSAIREPLISLTPRYSIIISLMPFWVRPQAVGCGRSTNTRRIRPAHAWCPESRSCNRQSVPAGCWARRISS